MSDVQANQIQYLCPRCQHNGQPYKFADDGPSQLRVLIRCEHCSHRWSALIARTVTK
jgi:DNA-directed RNA polymerase subunit RPC12/RpoP